MALLGKKSDAPAAPKAAKPAKPPKTPKPPKAPKASKGFGKKKGAQAGALNADELADLTGHGGEDAPPPPPPPPAPPRARKTMKNGTVLGLNIGQHSIKAVEVTVKGGNPTITGLGQIPTPGESIANGVVMNSTALASAIRELLKISGIKSKKTVSAVSGTGSLVVRVIEVPRMSDKDLQITMSQDAERYIPFPPSEVIMDFQALRELPSDPDAPNMEVLLAAAQREVVDEHINVLDRAKLDARAVDVEPLAAARAVSDLNAAQSGEEFIDYFDVSAVINLGATATEISVLRGDMLVFTRIVPKGGNDFTQSLIDHLALPWHDAERLKIEMADALPPQAGGVGANAASTEDWSDFGVTDNGGFDDFSNFDEGSFDNFDSFSDDAQATPGVQTAPTSPAAPATARVTDPFDPDFFAQGPQNHEPGEQHGQKENEPFNFDFSNFSLEPTPPPAAPEPTPVAPQGDEALPSLSAEPVTSAGDISFSFDSPETPDTPETTSWSLEPATAAATPAAPSAPGGLSFNFSDAAEESVVSTPVSTPVSTSAPPTPALDLPDFDTLAAEAEEEASVESATIESAYDLSDFTSAGMPLPPGGPAASPMAEATGEDEEFDLDTLFGSDAGADGFGANEFGALGTGVTTGAVAAGMGASPTGAVDDFGFGDLGGFENFGAGLGASSDAPMVGIDAATVYSILSPQLDELITEIRRSLEYHASRYPDAAVRRIVLIGGGARLRNLDAFFTQQLGIPSSVGNPLARLPLRTAQAAPDYIDQNGPSFTVALGLALRDMV